MNEGNTAAVAAMEWDGWLDPLEQALREGVHGYLRELLEAEVSAVLGRLRYGRQAGAKGYRNGHRRRELRSTLGRLRIDVPRARIVGADGRAQEFRSALLPRYRRLTVAGRNGAWLRASHSERPRPSAPVLHAGPHADRATMGWASSPRLCATHDAHLDGLRDDR